MSEPLGFDNGIIKFVAAIKLPTILFATFLHVYDQLEVGLEESFLV